MRKPKSKLQNALEWVAAGLLALGVILGAIAVFMAIWAAISAVSALVLCWAWNAFAVPVFGLPAIGFWQAFALLMLLGFIKSVVNVTVGKKEG